MIYDYRLALIVPTPPKDRGNESFQRLHKQEDRGGTDGLSRRFHRSFVAKVGWVFNGLVDK